MEQLSLLTEDNSKYRVECFSADNICGDDKRKELEDRYFKYVEITEKFDRQIVSFQRNKNNVVHRWLKYKEGFSAELVNELLGEMNLTADSIILDPFLGSGTTALVCQLKKIKSIGYDILPISKLAIEVKSGIFSYDINDIERLISKFRLLEVPEDYVGHMNYLTITHGAYPEETDRFLAYITYWIENSDFPHNIKCLFKLSVLNSLEEVSYTTKSGQYLSWDYRAPRTIEINQIRQSKGLKELPIRKARDVIRSPKPVILKELEKILYDIKDMQNKPIERYGNYIEFHQNSALYELPKLADDSISGVITSPPYCNRYDYTRTYALELAYLGMTDPELKELRQSLLSCTVENRSKESDLKKYYKKISKENRYNQIMNIIKNDPVFCEVINSLNVRQKNGELNNSGVVRMVEGYFTELCFIFAELYRVCKKGAMVAVVNDNVRYGGEVIPVDFISMGLAEKCGFKTKKIYVLKQQKGNSSQQMAKYGMVPLRKSITIWYK